VTTQTTAGVREIFTARGVALSERANGALREQEYKRTDVNARPQFIHA
jgi:hypothetical protein